MAATCRPFSTYLCRFLRILSVLVGPRRALRLTLIRYYKANTTAAGYWNEPVRTGTGYGSPPPIRRQPKLRCFDSRRGPLNFHSHWLQPFRLEGSLTMSTYEWRKPGCLHLTLQMPVNGPEDHQLLLEIQLPNLAPGRWTEQVNIRVSIRLCPVTTQTNRPRVSSEPTRCRSGIFIRNAELAAFFEFSRAESFLGKLWWWELR